MNNRTFFYILVTLTVLAGALWGYNHYYQKPDRLELAYALPKLDPKSYTTFRVINSLSNIVLKKDGDLWIMHQPYLFPVQGEKLFDLFKSLAQMKSVRLISDSTNDYSRLGVEDFSSAANKGSKVWLFFGDTSANGVVFGNAREAGVNMTGGRYFRRLGEKEVYLSDSDLVLPYASREWFVNQWMHINSKDIAQIKFDGDLRGKKIHWEATKKDASSENFAFTPKDPFQQGRGFEFYRMFDPIRTFDVTSSVPKTLPKIVQFQITTKKGEKLGFTYYAKPLKSPEDRRDPGERVYLKLNLQNWDSTEGKLLSQYAQPLAFIEPDYNLEQLEQTFGPERKPPAPTKPAAKK